MFVTQCMLTQFRADSYYKCVLVEIKISTTMPWRVFLM